jgi:hypothetical protein
LILVGSTARAVSLARQNDARLTAFTVVKELSEVSCSMLAIKPEGFVTPVALA